MYIIAEIRMIIRNIVLLLMNINIKATYLYILRLNIIKNKKRSGEESLYHLTSIQNIIMLIKVIARKNLRIFYN